MGLCNTDVVLDVQLLGLYQRYNLCGFFLFNGDNKLLIFQQVSAELKDETAILFGDKISYLKQF